MVSTYTTEYPAGTYGAEDTTASSCAEPPERQGAAFTADSVPASGLSMRMLTPVTSSAPQMLPPPWMSRPFTTPAGVTPNCTMPRSSVAGSYTKRWMVYKPVEVTLKMFEVPTA